ncbi:NAD(P)/FAD-dependent oxidoreductase [Flavobacteriaceae bacterium]|nr:NAD(P)/FAD-dependent oxidoreductase [Flavobacteriaceae bacterium]
MISKQVAVVGGGAAGFFSALSVKQHHPNYSVILFEKSSKLLTKVKISGGGRCNITHHSEDINSLCKAYPRGGKKLKSIFYQFNNIDTQNWFENRGVPLKTENDGRMFPVSNQSESVIKCLISECQSLEVQIQVNHHVTGIENILDKWKLNFSKTQSMTFDYVIITTGGSPKAKGFDWMSNLGHKIISPVPSLFTFNMPDELITKLMGVTVENVSVRIRDSKINTKGPLLITHWGMSGPSILKASSIGARFLSDKSYEFEIFVNWINETNTEHLFQKLNEFASLNPSKSVYLNNIFSLPNRLWLFLLDKVEIMKDQKWNEIGKKRMRKFIEILTQDNYKVSGKTTFKEEFVTCGGIDLSEIDMQNMKSKKVSNIYFAGEILNIDAITGGYNFQAAWSGGFVAGKLG